MAGSGERAAADREVGAVVRRWSLARLIIVGMFGEWKPCSGEWGFLIPWIPALDDFRRVVTIASLALSFRRRPSGGGGICFFPSGKLPQRQYYNLTVRSAIGIAASVASIAGIGIALLLGKWHPKVGAFLILASLAYLIWEVFSSDPSKRFVPEGMLRFVFAIVIGSAFFGLLLPDLRAKLGDSLERAQTSKPVAPNPAFPTLTGPTKEAHEAFGKVEVLARHREPAVKGPPDADHPMSPPSGQGRCTNDHLEACSEDELYQRTMKLAKRIYQLFDRLRASSSDKLQREYQTANDGWTNTEQLNEMRREDQFAQEAKTDMAIREYIDSYKDDALRYRLEVIKRSSPGTNREHMVSIYNRPRTSFDLEFIAEDLCRLAHELKGDLEDEITQCNFR